MCPTVCKTYRESYRLFSSKEVIQRRFFFFNFEICYRYELVIGPRQPPCASRSYDFEINRAITPFIKSILKSLVILANWLALIGAIYSHIALFFSLNRIFFPANENKTVKKQPITWSSHITLTWRWHVFKMRCKRISDLFN